MEKVLICKAGYEYSTLKPTVFDMLESVGSLNIVPGATVLIKPNFLAPAKPELAVTTHPLVVRAVVEYVLARGGRPVVSDSQAIGSFRRVMKEGGYLEALEGIDVACLPFKTVSRFDIGRPFGTIDIARRAIEADIVVNLAKLKTHTQMLLTLGIKNLFGCIVGFQKPEWHLRSGVDRHMFGRLLVQIHQAVNPTLTLIDGVLALDRQGPGKGGRPRELGILLAGSSAAATDAAVCKLLGLPADRLPTNRAARELGLLKQEPVLVGPVDPIRSFELPVMAPLSFGPRRLRKTLRKHLIQRPAVDRNTCRMCGECWQYCPAGAISPHEKTIRFDYDSCIRCYCCIEVCPHGALAAVETMPGRFLRRFTRLRGRHR
jgi:uncharacterized protein (DUF362 family)/Pyruvate/2-oxoacid:ferredoxin oxidoreductase delta subunit